MSDRLAVAIERLADTLDRDPYHDEEYLHIGAQHEAQRVGLGLFFTAVPGMAGLFDKQVPPSHYERRGDLIVLVCTCRRGPIRFMVGGMTECNCGRWFVATETTVRVAKLDPTEEGRK